jgi:hypothetical protein
MEGEPPTLGARAQGRAPFSWSGPGASSKKKRGAAEALGDTAEGDGGDGSSSASASSSSSSSSSSLSRRERGRMTRRGLGEMGRALDMIPAEEKKALAEALERAPELVRLESNYERCVASPALRGISPRFPRALRSACLPASCGSRCVSHRAIMIMVILLPFGSYTLAGTSSSTSTTLGPRRGGSRTTGRSDSSCSAPTARTGPSPWRGTGLCRRRTSTSSGPGR